MIKKLKYLDGQFCPRCNGIWLEFEKIKNMYESGYLHAPSKLYHDDPPDFEYNFWNADIRCPSDNSILQTYSFKGIEIDACHSCKGLWLDQGEIEKLKINHSEDRVAAFFAWIGVESFLGIFFVG